ncbi:MAG: gamma-glutamyl-gamma-aminobutyrate hydrolase family protein [Bacilli bacterium]|nr:gamma-glutamyl-gamma-aminobutyrate hydrolase family protein [Bacilli bacterium]
MIGILGRLDYTPSGKEAYIVYKDLNDIVLKYDMNVIGIMPNEIEKTKELINMCDGVILSGGSNISKNDFAIIKYIYDNNIPCLGICMGMQEMAYLFGGVMKDIDNHYNKNHKVIISNSNIYGDKVMDVNSRHKSYIAQTDLEVVGRSEDGIIEMVEDKFKKFFVGVEWHPENMYDSVDAKILFDKFIDSTKDIKKEIK